MASHATHIRRIYNRPWRNGSLANPGKIPTCIQVSVRPETTGTLETMLEPCTQLPAGRTGLARVGRIDVLDGDSNGTGLVLEKALQLPERPAVQPCAHAPAYAEAIADVREVFHHDRGGAHASGFLENRLARFVVDVFDTPPLLAGDLPEFLNRTLAAVGLEATTQGQMLITPMAQCLSAPDPPRAGGGESIFPDIHTHYWAGCHPFAVGRRNGEIEKPFPSSKHQFRFPRQAARQDPALVIPEDHRHQHASLQGVERDRLALERVGAMVEMDAGAVKRQGWNWRVLGDASQSSLRAIRLAYREDGVARHLRAQRGLLPQAPVTELMQGDPIPTARGLHQRYEPIAGVGVGHLQCTQSGGLLRRHIQSNAGGAHHALAPLGDMLGTLDIRYMYIRTGQALDPIPPLVFAAASLSDAGGGVCTRGADEARCVAARVGAPGAGRERARGGGGCSARRGAAWHRVPDGRAGREARACGRCLSRRQSPTHHVSGGADGQGSPGGSAGRGAFGGVSTGGE